MDFFPKKKPERPCISEGEIFLLQTRLTAVQECVRRARFALMISFFAALVTCVTLWNAAFSLDRLTSFSSDRIIARPVLSNEAAKSSEEMRRDGIRDELQKQIVDHWLNGLYISIPFLGVSVGANDFAIYNSAAMLFLIIYHLLSKRRENREIGWLLRDLVNGRYTTGVTTTHKREIEITAYRAVCAFMIFNVPTHNDRPIETIIDQRAAIGLPAHEEEIKGLRSLIGILSWAPFTSICCTLVYSAVNLRSESTQGLEPIFVSTFSIIFESLLLILVSYFTAKTIGFMRATRLLIVEFRERENESQKNMAWEPTIDPT